MEGKSGGIKMPGQKLFFHWPEVRGQRSEVSKNKEL
jgi:hypothetical protein